jgi:hypothetical protein
MATAAVSTAAGTMAEAHLASTVVGDEEAPPSTAMILKKRTLRAG